MTIKFLSLNVNGLNHPAKRHSLWSEIRDSRADVIAIQETHFKNSQQPSFSHKDFPHIFFASAPEKKRGVMILVKNSVAFSLRDVIRDPDGRFLILQGDFNSLPLTLVSIYAPNSHQLRFLHRVIKRTRSSLYGSMILCGDFNTVVDNVLDVSGQSQSRRPTLSPLLHKEQLYDVWRCLHGSERDYSFYSSRHRSYSRIDLFITGLPILGKTSSSAVKNITWSDHAAVEMVVEEGGPRERTSIWRCNTRILQDPLYGKEIRQRSLEFFELNTHSVTDPWSLWGAHKAFIQGICIQQTARANKSHNLKLQKLLSDIKNLESSHKQTPTQHVLDKLTLKRSELKTLLMLRYDRHLKTLRLRYYSQANRAGKF